MYWVGNLTTIEVLEEIEKSEIEKLVLLETVADIVGVEDYNYYDSTDKAMKIQHLLEYGEEEKPSETVYIKAVDGLEKNETLSIFQEAYIKITGADAPAFLAPDMPKGMQVKQVFYFSNGTTAWASYEKAKESLEILHVDSKEGISISAVLKEIGFIEGEIYIFTASDGYIVEIDGGDLDKGLLFQDEKGRMNAYFDGLTKNTSVKDLLSIETK